MNLSEDINLMASTASKRKSRMAQRKAVEECFTWIADEQLVHETADYGSNQKSVSDALTDQTKRVRVVKEYSGEVDKLASAIKDGDKKSELTGAYDGLQTVANKRLGCLEQMSQIAGLEEFFNNISIEFAKRASHIVSDASAQTDDVTDDVSGDGIARAAQGCILSLGRNWSWISKLVNCTDIHLKHARAYHEFFHDVKEYQQWMRAELNKAKVKVENKDFTGTREQNNRLLLDLQEVLTLFLHWQGKIDRLFDRSQRILPVPLRTTKLDYYRPVAAICNYKTKEIDVSEGEELTLLDNSKHHSWLIRNMHTKESYIPSVTCIIPGPDPDAVQAALRLRLQLLGIWTLHIKRIGMNLIGFLMYIIKDWNPKEVKMLKAMSATEKKNLQDLLSFVEEVLSRYWSEHPDYVTLMKRIETTKRYLLEQGNAKDADPVRSKELLEQLKTLEEMLRRYKVFGSYWETFKVIADSSKGSQYMLATDKWEDLMFLEITEILRRIHNGFKFIEEKAERDETDFQEVTEVITKTETETVSSMANGHAEETITTEQTVSETAKTDQMTTSEQEEKKTFVITGVVDPRTGEEVSMHKAVTMGIINNTDGTYVNPDTKEKIPIPVAMNKGKIKVEFTTTRKTAEKRRDIGLITIETQRESRPYTVKGVMDAKPDQEISVDDAITRGILDQKKGVYKNTMTDTDMSLSDAIDSGLLLVEFDKDAKVDRPETVSKTYAIHAVVDQKTKSKVTFTEAIRKGLINKETGSYYHGIRGESIYVGDAIKLGFIKATVVKDPKSLDIDPDNQIVAAKVQSIKSKLLNPLVAISAMRKAASAELGK